MSYTSQASQPGVGGATSLTCSKPSSVSSGVQLTAILMNFYGGGQNALGAVTPPSGWTQVNYESSTDSTGTLEMWLFAKTAGGSEPSNYTWTWVNLTSNSGISGALTIYNLGNNPLQPGTSILAAIDYNSQISWSAPSQSGTTQQILTQIFAQQNGASQYPGMTRAAAENGALMTPYTATVPPGAVPTRTAASASPTGFQISQGLVGFFLTVPSAPANATLISPVGGAPRDALATIPFQFIYHATDGAAMNGYALQIKLAGGTFHWWDATAGTLTSTTEVWNAISPVADGDQFEIDLPPSILANLNTYNWSVNTQESAANLRGSYPTAGVFVTQPGPTAVITSPTTGATITTTNSPKLVFTETLHSGSVQIAYQAVVESGSFGSVPGSGTPAFDTGVIHSAVTTTESLGPLPNLTSFRAFLQITQTGDQTSQWVHVDFTISVTPPNTPTLTVALDVDPATQMPRTVCTVTGSDTGPLWTFANTVMEVQSSFDGGATFSDCRFGVAIAPNSSDVGACFDYEFPFGGVGVTYRARVRGTPGANEIDGAWSASVLVIPYSKKEWVFNPLDPSSALQLSTMPDAARARGRTSNISYAMGRPFGVIQSDVWQAYTGATTWICANAAQYTALIALLQSGATLLRRTPNRRADAGKFVYFAPIGTIEEADTGTQLVPSELISVAWAQREKP